MNYAVFLHPSVVKYFDCLSVTKLRRYSRPYSNEAAKDSLLHAGKSTKYDQTIRSSMKQYRSP